MLNPSGNMAVFHGHVEIFQVAGLKLGHDTQFTYKFENFFHPFVGELIEKLNKASLSGMLDPTFQDQLRTEFFDQFYTSQPSSKVSIEHSPKEIDVQTHGPYANYNWELLFHIPLTVAVHLSKNQRFQESQHWFHYIFDPTCSDPDVLPPQRFWKFLAFRQADDVTRIDQLLALLSKPDEECTPSELALKDSIRDGYEAIKNKPFQPHAVARTRHVAYQYSVVMKYLDNLIAWGDSLFRQDTIESINEATQRYVLAANILGPRPQRVPSAGEVRPKTFAELKQQGLDEMGNALVELEGQFPFNLAPPQVQGSDPEAASALFGLGRTLYFCIPRNDKLLTYWDTLADRLFKIRHCMNIEGMVRQLALFDPPIDPGMLVKAAAAGIDIGSILGGLNQPTSLVRASVVIQKALQLCAEVRGLGSSLLSAIEKGDGEHLALLRQSHEIKLQQMTQDVRFLQWKQAQEATEALLRGRASAVERYQYYQRLLGLETDSAAVPASFALDHEALNLTEENFEETYSALLGQYDLTVSGPDYPHFKPEDGRMHLHQGEDADLHEHADGALAAHVGAGLSDGITSGLAAIPIFKVKMAYWGVGGETELTGGTFFSNIGRALSSGFSIAAAIEEREGQSASKTASYDRRADDFLLQLRLAACELMQIGRQIIGSLIAEQVAHHEYLNVTTQIEQAHEVDQVLRDKFTNKELYLWMQGELSRLYYEYYRFAFDTARKAEQTMKRELMRPEVDATDYIKFNYWDGGRRGLLSGEALYMDLKRMEAAYDENNKREYELTKAVSLLQVNPIGLLQLRTTGRCTLSIPEELFDMDGPGHYFRRIKTVAVNIPCVAGPYTSVSCTLTLTKSSIRKSPLGDDYARDGSQDDRFADYFGAIQSVVTSTGTSDSGLFEVNLREERYLPFEGAGVVSEWQLELPGDVRQFDYDTITDVILQVRYTARDGGSVLRTQAVENLKAKIEASEAAGSIRLFSVRHEFPSEWSKFKNLQITQASPVAELSISLRAEHYPYWSRGRLDTVTSLDIIARTSKTVVEVGDKSDATGNTVSLVKNPSLGNLRAGHLDTIALPAPTGKFTVYLNDNSMDELWLALAWGSES